MPLKQCMVTVGRNKITLTKRGGQRGLLNTKTKVDRSMNIEDEWMNRTKKRHNVNCQQISVKHRTYTYVLMKTEFHVSFLKTADVDSGSRVRVGVRCRVARLPSCLFAKLSWVSYSRPPPPDFLRLLLIMLSIHTILNEAESDVQTGSIKSYFTFWLDLVVERGMYIWEEVSELYFWSMNLG